MIPKLFTCLLILLTSQGAMAAEPFVVFDGMAYTGKPDLSAAGLQPINIVGSNKKMFEGGKFDEAAWSAAVTRSAADMKPLVLDIEEWRVSGLPKGEVNANIAKYLRALEIARVAAPKSKMGYYGLVPERNYWALVKKDQKALEEWDATNRSLSVIADKVDFIFPSIYTFYNDPVGWEVYAKAMLQEARIYKKPVYAFIWPEFHDSNKELAGQNIPAKFWAKQLELCRQYADGVVIWGGWQKPWDEKALWWVTTKEFMQKLPKR
jgi:hypothetical protein